MQPVMKFRYASLCQENMKISAALLTLTTVLLVGCASHPSPSTAPGQSSSLTSDGGLIHARYQGYSILYRLMSDEGNVDKILVVKSVDDPVKQLIKQIALTCSDAKTQLDDYQKQDGRSEFNVPDLPRLEQETRDLEAKTDEKELLFSSGKTFQLRLILTQLQATRYGQLLCTALAQIEDDPQRKDFLTRLASNLGVYHDQLTDMIAAK
jgi:hypothetical protein